jgi:hypothetical protein
MVGFVFIGWELERAKPQNTARVSLDRLFVLHNHGS